MAVKHIRESVIGVILRVFSGFRVFTFKRISHYSYSWHRQAHTDMAQRLNGKRR